MPESKERLSFGERRFRKMAEELTPEELERLIPLMRRIVAGEPFERILYGDRWPLLMAPMAPPTSP